MDNFGTWWKTYQHKSKEERLTFYKSLTRNQQTNLRQSFIDDGWCQLFCQNHIDERLDEIKLRFSIDLIDLRIKALKFQRVFLINRFDWEEIEHMILEYEPLFNSKMLFGGLSITPWGKRNQLVVIKANGET